MFWMPGPGPIVDLDARPAQLVDPAVLPDADRVAERAVPGAVLLRDDHDGEAVEPQRHVEPPEAEVGVVRGPSGWLGLADRADAPRAVPRPHPGVRRDRDLLAVDPQDAAPHAHLGEPPRVDDR